MKNGLENGQKFLEKVGKNSGTKVGTLVPEQRCSGCMSSCGFVERKKQDRGLDACVVASQMSVILENHLSSNTG